MAPCEWDEPVGDVVRVLVVVGAWALAHHVGLHLNELTDLGGQGAAEAVALQILGWGGEGAIRGDGIPVIQAVNASERE